MILSWAIGSAKNFAKAKNKSDSYANLKRLLKKPVVTNETRRAFDKMSKSEQDDLKSIAGWISGAQCSGAWRNKKNILPRDLATIDIDYAGAELPELIKMGLTGISNFDFVAHSSRRHSPEAPRIRMFVPFARKVSVDEYIAIVRYLGWKLDSEMKLVDMVSYRPAQMMFLPTCSKDDARHFFYHENDGELLEPDEVLEAIDAQFGDWRDLNNLPHSPDEHDFRKRAEKAEDPLEKRGPVGDFCRAYDIEAAIEKFLPDTYIPGDEHSGNPRYTYAGSTSSNGAVVYDNGRFMYSHHGHDPICDMNVNAFDLVRIHLFGDKDEKAKEDTGPKEMPSYKAMLEFISEDPQYRKQQAEARYDLSAMFDDAGIEADAYEDTALDEDEDEGRDPFDSIADDEDSDPELDDLLAELVGDTEEAAPAKKAGKTNNPAHKRRFPKPPKDWFPDKLELNQNGDIMGTLHNVAVLIQYDPRFNGKIGFNDFTKQIVVVDDVKSQLDTVPPVHVQDPVNGDRWQDFNDISIRAVLEAPNGPGKPGYGMKVTDRDLSGAVVLAAHINKFHPIKEYLSSVKWDGQKRMDRLFIDYLETPDTPYHREVARLMLVAAVVRVFEPGHKFDNAAIIGGRQGMGKSTFIKVLHGEKWFGEIHCDLADKQAIAEEIAGKWGVELPEMSGFHKSDHNAAKAFMRRQHDDVRMAYDRRVSIFPRQCVFWGTTNDATYLKDPTGNRSYWPVVSKISGFMDLSRLSRERDLLWAEAVAEYKAMRAAQPHGDLALTLTPAALREAEEYQEEARTKEVYEGYTDKIRMWFDEPVLLAHFLAEFGIVGASFQEDGGPDPETTYVRRTAFTISQATVALGLPETINNNQTWQQIQKAISEIPGILRPQGTTRLHGKAGRYYLREGRSQFDTTAYEIIAEDPADLI